MHSGKADSRSSTNAHKMLPHVRWRTSTFHTISRRLQSSLSQVEVDVASSSSTVPPTPTPTASSPSESETTEAETPFPVQTPLAAKLRRERRKGQGTIFIRPWDGVKSMPEAFAIIRGVERKYGKIRDFMLMRVTSFFNLNVRVSTQPHPPFFFDALGLRQPRCIPTLFLGRVRRGFGFL